MKNNYKQNDLIMFLDTVGHLCVAEFLEQDSLTVTVKNPAFAGLVPIDKDNLRIDVTPWIFRGFLADDNESTNWVLSRKAYSWVDSHVWDHRVLNMYHAQFAPVKEVPKTVEQEAGTIGVDTPVENAIEQANQATKVFSTTKK